jgi:HAD superfamily hydrolase (TIGR01509 family)
MIKAVIFDMDGVVVDTGLTHNLAEQRVLGDIGIRMTIDEIRKYAGQPAEAWFKEVLRKHNKSANVDELVKKKHDIMYAMLEDEIPVIPGFLGLFESLKKNRIKVALASGSQRRFIDFILSRLKIKFDVTISYEDISSFKPDPGLFLAASKKLRIEHSNCLVIEDAYFGVIAAKKAGMKCVGLINKNSGKQDLSEADLIIDDLNKLTFKKIQELFKK